MRRKKFSKKRFYRRLQAQGFAKGGLVIGGVLTPPWLMSCCEGFPNLTKAAGKAAEKFLEVAESLKGLQPPNIETIKTNIFIDGFDLGSAKDFSITYSRT